MISFFTEEITFKIKEKAAIKKWIQEVCNIHKSKAGAINYIFCNDAYLLEVNKTYLQHDYFTDIITFDQSENEDKIEADIYISIDRVADNANKNSTDFETELRRVMIHGILHLLGYGDKSINEQEIMRKKEDEMLILFKK